MKIVKFLTVGFLGMITNVVLFYTFVDVLQYPAIQISVISFVVASIQNYIINHKWTFVDATIGSPVSYANYFKYLSVGIISLSVNLIVLQTLIDSYQPDLKVVAQIAGICAGTLINYLGSKHWVFRAY